MKQDLHKQMIVIGVIFMALIVVSGCIGDTEETEETESKSSSYEGIDISFIPGAPPTRVANGDAFDIDVKIENKGENQILSGDIIIYILGLNPNTMTGLGDGLRPDGITPETPINQSVDEAFLPARGETTGGITDVEWLDLSYDVIVDSDQNLGMVTQACYYYGGKAEATACFNTNPFTDTASADTCKVEGEKDVSNTRAPIQVTKLVETPAGTDKYAFTWTIKNLGDGEVFDRTEALNKCTNLRTSDLDQVYVKNVYIGGTEVCESKTNRTVTEEYTGYKVRLVDGEGQFTCTVDLSVEELGTGEYTELIRLILEYGYYEREDATMTIKTQFARCVGTSTNPRCSTILKKSTCDNQEGCNWES